MKPRTAKRDTPSSDAADLGFAHLDLDRQRRRGLAEVVYAPGKSPEQIVAIVKRLNEAGQNGWVTRLAPGVAEQILAALPDAVYHATARMLTCDIAPFRASADAWRWSAPDDGHPRRRGGRPHGGAS